MSMRNFDSEKHVCGSSQFVDDFPVPEGTLYAHVFSSRVAHGKIRALDISAARVMDGVHGILTAHDIPGENQIGGIVQDEPLLAQNDVHYIGQPMAIVVADSAFQARHAAEKIIVEIDKLPVITDPREAQQQNELLVPPMKFELGNVDAAWKQCDVIVKGTAETGGQEHLYLETQGAIAIPVEHNGVKIISSTQSPTAVQRVASKVLGVPMHKVEVDVLRLGGGFGGKEDQASCWAAMAALAATTLHRPIKLILHRQDDMRMTGKRHPYSSDYTIGLKKDGTILAYEAVYFQNGGAATDLSPAILQRTLFHCTNSYFIPNVKAVGYSCRTNLPPNTAFRGFGGPQGKFVIEAAIFKAAEQLHVEPLVIQKKNLLKNGEEFPYGQIAERCQAQACWNELEKNISFGDVRKRISEFNAAHTWKKKGYAVMPICFGISFTNTMLNQASALVHIYNDGSVGISTAAVEMGQGVNMKILSIAQRIFSIPPERIKLESTNTTRVANSSATAASSGADLNGAATQLACNGLVERLTKFAAEQFQQEDVAKIELRDGQVLNDGNETGWDWKKLIASAYASRISLTSQHYYATPNIYFDIKTSKGRPFAYHVYGAAIAEVTMDCLRGTYEIDAVNVVHDFGKSLIPAIDLSQAEGALMQGIGWMTMEEILYNADGKLLTDALSTYKVPDMHFAPKELNIHFLENSDNPVTPFNSKAIGEPPFMYGIGVYFALVNAMKAFRPDKNYEMIAPMTPERALCSLYDFHVVPVVE
ncbi:MAG TPA: molybdopterin cofactor-binding domain-containing protein [Bacteroidota bacterium]|nr:molybdopterin cofactor-binding domain-containing protein [Bacteroidota bacterium]